MKVLYDYEIFSIQKYGGATRYFYELISRLSRKSDLEIMLWMGLHICKYEIENYKNNFFYFKSHRVPFIPKTKMLSVWLQKPFFNSFYKKSKFDLFHQTFYTNYKKNEKAKMIVTIHDFTPEKYPHHFSKINNTIESKKIIVRKADGIICISNNTKKDLLELYNIPESKIKVIYHGNSLKADPGETPLINEPYLLYVGDRRTYKNFELVLKAYMSSPGIVNGFKILCFGGGKFNKKEILYLQNNGLENKVIQREGSDKMLASAYKHASVFIYPSFYEGFGIPLLEAMYYSCPILASNSSCFPEIAGDAALYFNPRESSDLTEKLEMIINNHEIRNKLIKAGIEREKEFSWDKCADDTYEFYKYILGK